ncbi:MAG TPA: hypothetical protein VFW45_03740 [Candidatus Polarisedimenticolia bacterium]|nr:hypothetical protein [Candidatus Polarisedimenticolia bacterium]
MRKVVLAVAAGVVLAGTALVALTGVALPAETGKGAPVDVGPGRVAWFDITTTNLPKSAKFYGELFKWDLTPLKGTDQAMEIVSGGTSIGTIRVAEGTISSFNGVVYIQVPDIQISCKNAKMLGGNIPEGFPFNLPDGKGSVAVVIDPAGHPIGLYSKTLLPPAPSAAK